MSKVIANATVHTNISLRSKSLSPSIDRSSSDVVLVLDSSFSEVVGSVIVVVVSMGSNSMVFTVRFLDVKASAITNDSGMQVTKTSWTISKHAS